MRSKDGKAVCLSVHVGTEVTRIGTDHSVTIEVCTMTRAQAKVMRDAFVEWFKVLDLGRCGA